MSSIRVKDLKLKRMGHGVVVVQVEAVPIKEAAESQAVINFFLAYSFQLKHNTSYMRGPYIPSRSFRIPKGSDTSDRFQAEQFSKMCILQVQILL